MYIKVDDHITPDQLVAIAKVLNTNGVECINNIHYEVCKYEVECVIDNAMDQESAEKFKAENAETVERWTDELYYKADYQWECLYEKAEYVVDLELDEIDIEEL